MAKHVFSNVASALLAASIDDNDLTIQVDSGYGALYPSPSGGDYFVATLRNAAGDVEYCKITARAGDLLTVPPGGRGFDGSSGQSWTNGQTRVELRVVKNTLEAFIQRGGDTMEGGLDMDGNDLTDPVITGDWVGNGGQLVGTALRGTEDDSSNEIVVPNDGSRATSGGDAILTEGDAEGVMTAAFDVGMIMMWYGAAINVPDGWAICDGANDTPDMRDRFAVGAGTTYAVNDTGGAASQAAGVSGGGGGHTHTTTSGSHVLTASEMPSHGHRLHVFTSGANSTVDGVSNAGAAVAGEIAGPNGYITNDGAGSPVIEATGGGAAHTHPDGTTDNPGNHTHTIPAVATLPPYRALYYIMFIGF